LKNGTDLGVERRYIISNFYSKNSQKLFYSSGKCGGNVNVLWLQKNRGAEKQELEILLNKSFLKISVEEPIERVLKKY